LDLNRRAKEPPIEIEQVLEAIDYLLMARWLQGDRVEGYSLSPAWERLNGREKEAWCESESTGRDWIPLENPALISRPEGRVFEWENLNWFKFHFCVCRWLLSDDFGDVAVIQGLYLGRKPTVLEVKSSISNALTSWYKLPLGGALWHGSGEDLNVSDLAANLNNFELKTLLEGAGVKDLSILDLSASTDWIYDDVLGEGGE
jgi:hypothetical protein